MKINVGQIRAVNMHGATLFDKIFVLWHPDESWILPIKELIEAREGTYEYEGFDTFQVFEQSDVFDVIDDVQHFYGRNHAVDISFEEHELELPEYHELPNYLPDQIGGV